MVEAANHPNITLMTYSEVESVGGFVGNFEVTDPPQGALRGPGQVHRLRRMLEQVPAARKSPANSTRAWADRTAIYRAFPQAVPNKPVIDAQHCLMLTKGTLRGLRQGLPARGDQLQGRRRTGQGQGRRHRRWPRASSCGTTRPTANTAPGEIADVIDGFAFERLASASGPTGGRDPRAPATAPSRRRSCSCSAAAAGTKRSA